jgi:processive 1,2-diacylglycerol beta-glucosyltransferase
MVYKKTWSNLFLKFPRLYEIVYKMTDINEQSTKMTQKIFNTLQLMKLEAYYKGFSPDIVVSMHFLGTHLFGELKKMGVVKVPVIAAITDPFDYHSLWYNEDIDELMVFSKKAKRILSKSLPPEKIKVFNYPLGMKFSKKIISKEKARQKLGIDEKFTILMTSGGEGVGNIEQFLSSILKKNMDMNVHVVCGRNEELKKTLEKKIKRNVRGKYTIHGFVDNMDELLSSCDVFVGKGGANMTMEALVTGKPIIFSHCVQNEKGIVEFVTKNKMGWYKEDSSRFVKLLMKLIDNPRHLEIVTKNIEKQKFKSGTDEVSEYILSKIASKPI